MKNRKRGFSLVELLIVLAVIAALIATITPVALNAIRKSKATQVAQNLKTLASAFENAVYVNDTAPTLDQIGRDIDDAAYDVYYTATSGVYKVIVLTTEDAHSPTVIDVLQDVDYGQPTLTNYTSIGNSLTSSVKFYYSFTFDKY